ncbi:MULTISPECIES: hypothetical protein [Streptomyces]|uniref:hypothetical protein n=1 Tax=Streptomyces TaxID=1883 RepID=UPI000AD149B7|nr:MULTISPECIES: hypothetical protein [Streptomyces]
MRGTDESRGVACDEYAPAGQWGAGVAAPGQVAGVMEGTGTEKSVAFEEVVLVGA